MVDIITLAVRNTTFLFLKKNRAFVVRVESGKKIYSCAVLGKGSSERKKMCRKNPEGFCQFQTVSVRILLFFFQNQQCFIPKEKRDIVLYEKGRKGSKEDLFPRSQL